MTQSNLFKITTLQKRLTLFVLVPAAFLLFGMGLWGFMFARNIMLDQWNEAAILKLQRAAHYIHMRLDRPIEWIEMFHKTGGTGTGYASPEWILEQLGNLEGVTKVKLEWKDKTPERTPMSGRMSSMGGRGMMQFHQGTISEVTPPHYDAQSGQETVSLISQLKDESGRIVGTLQVSVAFKYLMQDIQTLGWWQSDVAYLVDESGHILARTELTPKRRTRLGETDDPLELALLEAIKEGPSGTLRSPGHPAKEVAGFYKIADSPWVTVLFAPGEKILAPIIRFRDYSFLAGSLCILLIILLIRTVIGKITDAVKNISEVAQNVARGVYGDPLPITQEDEIGQLTRSFNTMVLGLKERDFISNTFGRYVDQEIAQELLKRPEASRLGGEKRAVAILMSDLRNFTSLCESLSPEDTIRFLNRYFARMIEIIQRHRGIIVDFFGDGVLVFFDPFEKPVAPSVRKAVRCAMEMQNSMQRFNVESVREGVRELRMGIGVHAGQVVVGNIGSEARAKYGIVGAPVNLTHRIQAVAGLGEVVISDLALGYVREGLTIKKSFSVELKGVRDPVRLHVVEGSFD